MKRSIATITVYTFGDTEQERFAEAQRIAKEINDREDGARADVEAICNQDFGEMGCRDFSSNPIPVR